MLAVPVPVPWPGHTHTCSSWQSSCKARKHLHEAHRNWAEGYLQKKPKTFLLRSFSLSFSSNLCPFPPIRIPIPLLVWCMCNEGELSGTQDAVHWHTVRYICVLCLLRSRFHHIKCVYIVLYRLIWVLCARTHSLSLSLHAACKWEMELVACLLIILVHYTSHHITYPYLYEINVCTFNANWFLFDSVQCVRWCFFFVYARVCVGCSHPHIYAYYGCDSKVLEHFRRKVKY